MSIIKQSTHNAKRGKIVVIEDDDPIRELYVFKLKLDGFEVESAENGEVGLKVIKDFMPDVILLDLKMPVMTGDEMLEKLRTHDWASDIKVIVLTNISRDEAPLKLRYLNVDRYIVKAHYTPKQVVDMIDDVLGVKL